MEYLRKNKYVLPVTEVIEFKHEGIICDSGEVPDMEHGWDIEFCIFNCQQDETHHIFY